MVENNSVILETFLLVEVTYSRVSSCCSFIERNRNCSYFLSHPLLNTGEFKEHRGQEFGDNVL